MFCTTQGSKSRNTSAVVPRRTSIAFAALCLMVGVGGNNLAIAQVGHTTTQTARQASRRAAVDGYDLTALIDDHRLVKGTSRLAVRFDRRTYYFASREAKQQFQNAPHRYVPVLSGDCIVCLENHGVRIPGRTRFAVVHQGRLFLFPTAATRREFLKSPDRYAATDLAADGNSVVALVEQGRNVPGQPEWTAVFGGLRFQFTSAAERQRFLRQRGRYVALAQQPRHVAYGAPATGGFRRPVVNTSSRELTSLQIAGGAAPSQLFQLGALRNGLTAELQALRNLDQAATAR